MGFITELYGKQVVTTDVVFTNYYIQNHKTIFDIKKIKIGDDDVDYGLTKDKIKEFPILQAIMQDDIKKEIIDFPFRTESL